MSTHASKKLVALGATVTFTAAMVVGAAAPAFASKPVDGAHKVSYCHATHSAKNPFVYITTDKVAVVRAHEKHQDEEDVIPAFWYVWDGELLWFPGQGDPSQIGDGSCTGDGGVG